MYGLHILEYSDFILDNWEPLNIVHQVREELKKFFMTIKLVDVFRKD